VAPIVAMSLPAFGPISTPRRVIREVRHSDPDDLFEVNGDHEVTRLLPYASWQSPEDGVAWFTRMTGLAERGSARPLVVVRNDNDKVIGTLRTRWVAKGAAYDTDMYGLLSGEWPYPAADRQRTTSAAR
jgi:RimJ/RimL family protein N-acetyltransferase